VQNVGGLPGDVCAPRGEEGKRQKGEARTAKVVTLCGSMCRMPMWRGVVEGTLGGNPVAGSGSSASDPAPARGGNRAAWRVCSAMSHCHTWPSSVTAITSSDSGCGAAGAGPSAALPPAPHPPLKVRPRAQAR
jgi:hypothetical protein